VLADDTDSGFGIDGGLGTLEALAEGQHLGLALAPITMVQLALLDRLVLLDASSAIHGSGPGIGPITDLSFRYHVVGASRAGAGGACGRRQRGEWWWLLLTRSLAAASTTTTTTTTNDT